MEYLSYEWFESYVQRQKPIKIRKVFLSPSESRPPSVIDRFGKLVFRPRKDLYSLRDVMFEADRGLRV